MSPSILIARPARALPPDRKAPIGGKVREPDYIFTRPDDARGPPQGNSRPSLIVIGCGAGKTSLADIASSRCMSKRSISGLAGEPSSEAGAVTLSNRETISRFRH